jgi:hypothetical protein
MKTEQYYAIFLKNDCLFTTPIDAYDAAKFADDHTDKISEGYDKYPRKIVLVSDIKELYPHIVSFLQEYRN